MTSPPTYRDPSGDDTGMGPNRRSSTSTPRWVKVFGIVALVLVLLVVIIIFAGGGSHGPGRHTPLASVTEHGAQPS